jgi:hypothetical protein
MARPKGDIGIAALTLRREPIAKHSLAVAVAVLTDQLWRDVLVKQHTDLVVSTLARAAACPRLVLNVVVRVRCESSLRDHKSAEHTQEVTINEGL